MVCLSEEMNTRLKNKILDQERLTKILNEHRHQGHSIVLIIGTWDMLHLGHLRTLNEAKKLGDILVVGVDSDRVVKIRKGAARPIIPQGQRMTMLAHQQCVSSITLIDDLDEHGMWQLGLLKAVRPDVFAYCKGSFARERLCCIKRFCKRAVPLTYQEGGSTSSIIQTILERYRSYAKMPVER